MAFAQNAIWTIAVSVLTVTLSSCAGIPDDALVLSPESLEQRQLQTRVYEGISETDLLAACAGVIQDLGFMLDESETKLGIIVGSKSRDATDAGQMLGAILAAALTGVVIPVDQDQKLRVALVTRSDPNSERSRYFTRVTFQRIVWNTQGEISRQEALDDPEIYINFFSRLSKAVFLEGHKI